MVIGSVKTIESFKSFKRVFLMIYFVSGYVSFSNTTIVAVVVCTEPMGPLEFGRYRDQSLLSANKHSKNVPERFSKQDSIH